MPAEKGKTRRKAVNGMKRDLILDAARRVFERDGLEGASLRAIASEAGYTPAALYFHFDSREAVYAALLSDSLDRLNTFVGAAVDATGEPAARLAAAITAFYRYYADNPGELELGFYLFRGGMRPKGLGAARNADLNAKLTGALAPITLAAIALGASDETSRRITAGLFAQASGALLLANTGRLRLFGVGADDLLDDAVAQVLAKLGVPRSAENPVAPFSVSCSETT